VSGPSTGFPSVSFYRFTGKRQVLCISAAAANSSRGSMKAAGTRRASASGYAGTYRFQLPVIGIMRLLWALVWFCCSLLAIGQSKVKNKGFESIAIDKSKPIRRGIEDWYSRNTDAFKRKDLDAVMALRTADFHTLTPDGKSNDRKFMEDRTRSFLSRIDSWIFLRFEIGTIEVQGDLASAYVTQDTKRFQRLPDGTLHQVESKAVQRETFRRTPEGWKLYTVDDIKDQGVFVDGKRISNQTSSK
jgi:ketosteroid isomerase-like protein